jgi:pantothenate kinase-related protein Tda10
VVLSIDDLYLPHSAQKKLAESQPDNPLIQHRGQPSTHDISLGKQIFSQATTNLSTMAKATAQIHRLGKSSTKTASHQSKL